MEASKKAMSKVGEDEKNVDAKVSDEEREEEDHSEEDSEEEEEEEVDYDEVEDEKEEDSEQEATTTTENVSKKGDEIEDNTHESAKEKEEEKKVSKEEERTALLKRVNNKMETIFSGCPLGVGKSLSRQERLKFNLKSQSLAYAEINIPDFLLRILLRVKTLHCQNCEKDKIEGTFVDLGSGTGKPVFVAALSGFFDRCVGIEILETVHSKSTELLERYKGYVLPHLPEMSRHADIVFYRDDLTLADWQDASCVFTLCTTFTEDVLNAIRMKARLCQIGTWFVTVTHPLRCEKYKLLERVQCEMSFGAVSVFVQRKIY